MALRANVLAKGFSGIRLETLEALIAMLNAGVHPIVPSRGSVGASGDLAPLAHIALVLIGEGEAWDDQKIRTTITAEPAKIAEQPPHGICVLSELRGYRQFRAARHCGARGWRP